MVTKVEPYFLESGEGHAFPFLDTMMVAKATGAQTGGRLGLVEQVLPAGSQTSYHVHHNEDEYWYVLEGDVSFISGERRIEAGAGSFVFMPRDVPHGLHTRMPARLLVFSTPAGFVDFAIAMGELAAAGDPQAAAEISAARRALSEKYNIEVLGPLPD